MSIDEQSMSRTYSGSVASADLDLGKLLNQEKKFGKVDFNVELKGFNYKNRYPESYIKGIISSFEYSQYQYEKPHCSSKLTRRMAAFNESLRNAFSESVAARFFTDR